MFLLNRTRRTVYMAISFVLTYGSLIGIWYFFGIWVALAAFATNLLVRMVSIRHYFTQAVREYAEAEYQDMVKARANANVPPDELDILDRLRRIATSDDDLHMNELAMRQKAYDRARYAIKERVMRG